MNINKPVGPQCIIIGREENRNGRKQVFSGFVAERPMGALLNCTPKKVEQR